MKYGCTPENPNLCVVHLVHHQIINVRNFAFSKSAFRRDRPGSVEEIHLDPAVRFCHAVCGGHALRIFDCPHCHPHLDEFLRTQRCLARSGCCPTKHLCCGQPGVGSSGGTTGGGRRPRLYAGGRTGRLPVWWRTAAIGACPSFLHQAPLLDEPTSNLDSLNKAVILRSLQQVQGEQTLALVSQWQSTMGIVELLYPVEQSRMS